MPPRSVGSGFAEPFGWTSLSGEHSSSADALSRLCVWRIRAPTSSIGRAERSTRARTRAQIMDAVRRLLAQGIFHEASGRGDRPALRRGRKGHALPALRLPPRARRRDLRVVFRQPVDGRDPREPRPISRTHAEAVTQVIGDRRSASGTQRRGSLHRHLYGLAEIDESASDLRRASDRRPARRDPAAGGPRRSRRRGLRAADGAHQLRDVRRAAAGRPRRRRDHRPAAGRRAHAAPRVNNRAECPAPDSSDDTSPRSSSSARPSRSCTRGSPRCAGSRWWRGRR